MIILLFALNVFYLHTIFDTIGSKFNIDEQGISWSSVTKADEDWYRCSARNSLDVSHSPWAYLKVLGKLWQFDSKLFCNCK